MSTQQQLTEHRQAMASFSLREAFADSAGLKRAEAFSIAAAGLHLDYSKNLARPETLDLLCQELLEQRFPERRSMLLEGDPATNPTEGRAALHTLLRRSSAKALNPELAEAFEAVSQARQQVCELAERIRTGKMPGYRGRPVRDVINIGIGGSDLGPAMVCDALQHLHHPEVHCHFVSNVDKTVLAQLLAKLEPDTSLFIISSKSFTTAETLNNVGFIKAWMRDAGAAEQQIDQQFMAVTANGQAAREFGITADKILPIWDWVGGRYSLWSAIGLPIAIAAGPQAYRELLAGAEQMDEHFATAAPRDNMPCILAMLEHWYLNYWNCQALAVIPYDAALQLFPAHLQQLCMESNGKRTRLDGQPCSGQTCPSVYGGIGTDSQHSFHQLLHQGTQLINTDFILTLQGHFNDLESQDKVVANCLAQSRALMVGKTLDEACADMRQQGKGDTEIASIAPHKVMPGNRPSNILSMNSLSPATLGALIALYEHKIFVQSVLWDINAFDQWGVELGKKISQDIEASIVEAAAEAGTVSAEAELDASTELLIALYLAQRQGD